MSFPFALDASFAGGNIVVKASHENGARLRQDWSSSSEWWFHWAFRVHGAQGLTLRFDFCDDDVFSSCGPCISVDGENWRWLGREAVVENGFSYSFAAEEDEVLFAFSPLYTQANLDAFLAANSEIGRRSIGVSEGGRPIDLIAVSSEKRRWRVVLMARTHACEAMANFAMEGVFSFWLREPFLREWVDLEAVPLMDIDGVELGEQGKLRIPHDHNRDWTSVPRYNATRAVMQHIAETSSNVDVFLDMHCPWIRSGRNEELFFFDACPTGRNELGSLTERLEASQQAGLKFRADSTVGRDDLFNSGDTPTSISWFARHTSTSVCATLEVPYALCSGEEMTPQRARAFGEDLGRALALWLSSRSGATTGES